MKRKYGCRSICSLVLAAALAVSAVPANISAEELQGTGVQNSAGTLLESESNGSETDGTGDTEGSSESTGNTESSNSESSNTESSNTESTGNTEDTENTGESETPGESEKEEPALSGLVESEDGYYYYYVDGEVASDFTGLVEEDDSLWYVAAGKFDSSITGPVAVDGDYVYVTKGIYDTSVSGMYKCAAGWLYFTNGAHDKTYTGMAKNKYGWWYYKDGVLQTSYTGMAKNKYGWWYFSNGKLQTSYTGMAQNQYGWWYFSNGKLQSKYTGLATNDYGTWYFKNGKIYTNHAGNVKVSGKTYKINASGKVVITLTATNTTQASADVSLSKISSGMSAALKKIQGQTSGTKYYVVVDKKKFKVYVFENKSGVWTPKKEISCSIGAKGHETPSGTWTVLSRWSILKSSNSWEYYPVEFCNKGGAFCFHSVLYYKGVALKDAFTKAKIKNGTLGKAISHGCVRMSLANSKWIWENCTKGTKVLVY